MPDGSAPPAPADAIRVYQPSTRPGAPLPHAWIDDEDGNRRPVSMTGGQIGTLRCSCRHHQVQAPGCQAPLDGKHGTSAPTA